MSVIMLVFSNELNLRAECNQVSITHIAEED
jgi:hypothetical protein